MAPEPMHAFNFTALATHGQTEKFSRCEKPLSFSASHLFSRPDKTSEASFHLVPHSGTKSAGEVGKIENVTTAR